VRQQHLEQTSGAVKVVADGEWLTDRYRAVAAQPDALRCRDTGELAACAAKDYLPHDGDGFRLVHRHAS
jgi:hypothetical protein